MSAAPLSVLCFGDSNTHGTCPMGGIGEMRRYPPSQRWPSQLAAALPPGSTVIAEGHPGRTTVHDDPVEGAHKNGIRVLPALLETHRPIDLVIIMLGSNDFKARFSITAADVALSLARLAAVVAGSTAGPGQRAPDCLVVLPPPVAERGCLAGIFAGGAAKAAGLADAAMPYLAAQGVAVLDGGLHATVCDLDGVHLSPEGQIALGQAIAAAVTGAGA